MNVKTFINYLRDESGQTSTEYILLLAVVALIVIKFGKAADEKLKGLTGSVFGAGEKVVDKIEADIDSW